MNHRSSRGLVALAGSAFIALAVLVPHLAGISIATSPPGDANMLAAGVGAESLVVPGPVEEHLPLPVDSDGVLPMASARSGGGADSAQGVGVPAAEIAAVMSVGDASSAPTDTAWHPAEDVADRDTFGDASMAADPVPDAEFHAVHPVSGQRLVLRAPAVTTDFTLRFTCSWAEGVTVERCFLLDSYGRERLPGESVNLGEGSYEWVGTAVTSTGHYYRTTVSFVVEPADDSGPVVTNDWELDDDAWTNVASGVATAADPDTGVELLGLVVDDAELLSSPSDRLEFSLPDGVHRYYFHARNPDLAWGYSSTKVRRIDTVRPTVSVGSFGGLGLDGRVEVELGSSVSLDFSCEDERSGVASCSSTVPSSGLLDTSSLGEHVVTVTAVDEAGNRAEEQVRYVVIGAVAPQEDPEEPAQEPAQEPALEPAPQGGGGAPVVTDEVDQRPAVTGAADAASLAATGADAWWVAAAALVAFVLASAGGLMLIRRRATE